MLFVLTFLLQGHCSEQVQYFGGENILTLDELHYANRVIDLLLDGRQLTKVKQESSSLWVVVPLKHLKQQHNESYLSVV